MNGLSNFSSAAIDPEIPWWCLRTKPKMEAIATRFIRAMTDEIAVFNPTLKFRKKTVRGLVWFTEALFPGYLLVHADVALWKRALLSINGISGCVHFGNNLGTIPCGAIEQLRHYFLDDEVITVQEPYQEGDLVQIIDGPFQGAQAKVLKILPAQERIKLLVDFLGGKYEVEMPLETVLGDLTAKQVFASSIN